MNIDFNNVDYTPPTTDTPPHAFVWGKQGAGDHVYCKSHFEGMFPGAWNLLVVNGTSYEPLLNAIVGYYNTDEENHCEICDRLTYLYNDDDNAAWTRAWAEVGMLVGSAVAAYVIRGGGTGLAGMHFNANKPYPNFSVYVDKDTFERQLRYQCYMLLVQHGIKVSEVKPQVRRLIQQAYERISA